jgi:hypothetical protein
MDITFATTKLKKELSEEKAMVKAHGPLRTKKLKIVLAMLRAAPVLAIFGRDSSLLTSIIRIAWCSGRVMIPCRCGQREDWIGNK